MNERNKIKRNETSDECCGKTISKWVYIVRHISHCCFLSLVSSSSSFFSACIHCRPLIACCYSFPLTFCNIWESNWRNAEHLQSTNPQYAQQPISMPFYCDSASLLFIRWKKAVHEINASITSTCQKWAATRWTIKLKYVECLSGTHMKSFKNQNYKPELNFYLVSWEVMAN